ncbi:MAG: hypothetical protein OXF32_11995 [Anaerolineaceae bacterium]|nr:hypothetical protein [Anaerolineaceae bacterium]
MTTLDLRRHATGVAVPEGKTGISLAAQKLLWRQGLLAEPTSAVPVAALSGGQSPLEGRIVIPLTGSGLKSLA